MKIIMMISLLILLPLGIGLCIFVLKDSQLIFYGKKNTIKNRIRNAILLGLSVGILFFCIILIAGIFFEKNYSWPVNSIIMSIIISFILGLIACLGLLWQFFIVNEYRTKVLPRIINRQKKDD
jgi:hypothetical protein